MSTDTPRYEQQHWLSRDRVGALLLAALAIWIWVAARTHGGDAWDCLASLCVLVGCYVLARVLYRWAWLWALATTTAFGWWILDQAGSLEGGPLAPPLGYANANAALAIQVGGISLVAAMLARWLPMKLVLLLLSAGVMTVAIPNEGRAALITGGTLLIVAVAVTIAPPRSSTVWVLVAAGVVLAACVGQLLLANAPDSSSEAWISDRRIDLWSDAVDLTRAEPIFGFGAESFARVSPTALSDRDAHAAHSVLLETAVEFGLPAAILGLCLAAWVFASLGAGTSGPASIVGAAVWAAFLLQALVDYVADYPLVLAAVGVSVGLAVGGRCQESSMSTRASDHSPSRVFGD